MTIHSDTPELFFKTVQKVLGISIKLEGIIEATELTPLGLRLLRNLNSFRKYFLMLMIMSCFMKTWG